MLNDLKQPAKDWLADAIENLSGLLGDGDDPSFTLDVFGAEIEIRLNKLPGHFERAQIEVPNAELTGAPLGAPGARRPVARPVE